MTIKLLNTDCMTYMASLPDKAFDLAIVDPPYGIGTKFIKNTQNRTKLAKAGDYKHYPNNESDRPAPEYFVELARVSRNQIVWGANHLADLFTVKSAGWISWDKFATGNFSDGELAYTSFNRSLKIFRYQWNGMHQGHRGNKALNEKRIHPSQKPVALYHWLLKNYAESGQRILDTHLGSGSSAIAAFCFGCVFVGCEIDKDYHEAAVKRFNNETTWIGTASGEVLKTG